jgi:tRNA-Thr(GGU) m(6)t(6)A37 methyltransferase TsaA
MSGVFASRSPYRPNRIGLTIVELLKVEENVLYVKGLDAINGTPVLDIKPYIKKIEEQDGETTD